MEDIKSIIQDWLNDWTECSKCNDMIRNKHIFGTNEDEPICIDCKLEDTLP